MSWAHAGGAAEGLLGGLYHPMSGLDHVLAMIAVGLWGAQLGPPSVWALPVMFPIVMAFGGMIALLGVSMPGAEVGIAASAVVLGTMVLAEARPPVAVTALVVGSFALLYGHAHELPAGDDGVMYGVGFVVATGALQALGISIGVVHRWPSGRRALRATGAVVAVVGVVFLSRAIG